jgi:hypothetical protein
MGGGKAQPLTVMVILDLQMSRQRLDHTGARQS